MEISHIYVIGTTLVGGKVKIGKTSSPKSRLRQLQTGSHESYLFVKCALVRRSSEVEKALHLLLRNYHIKGEWFSLPYDVMKSVSDLINSMDIDCNCEACVGELNKKILETTNT